MKGLDLKGTTVADLAVYAATGLAVAAFGVLYGIHAAQTGGSGELPLRWIGLAGATAVTFGYPLRWYWRYWPQGLFWVAYSALLVFHLAIYWWVLTEAHRFGLAWFAIVTPLELVVICPTLEAAGKCGSPKVRGR